MVQRCQVRKLRNVVEHLPMALRWGVAGLIEAERKFRRVKGYRGLPQLVAALDRVMSKDSLDRKEL
jgi:hypothetical protein